MLLLEGCDCSGKTTLAIKLQEYYSSEVIHHMKHDNKVMMQYAISAKPGTSQIVDRFHLSEVPYSMYYRHIVPDYAGVNAIDLALRDRRVLQIVCVPPWITVKQHWQARKEDELIQSLQALHGIYMWYKDKCQAFSSMPIWKYDYTVTPFESLCEEINTWVKENE